MNKIIFYIFFILYTLFILYNINKYYSNKENDFYYINNIYNNKINYYNNAYVINLNSQTDRWIQINKDFKNSSINLVRLPAIRYIGGELIIRGHTGCGLSFMKAVHYAKKNNLNTILIFEDDNKPLKDFDKRWNIIKRWLDKNLDKWDIFNGGARLKDWNQYDTKKQSINVFKTKMIYEIENSEYLFQTNEIMSTNWIYINKNAYDKVLKWQLFVNNRKDYVFKPIDAYLGNIEYFKSVFCIPHLALQYDGQSSTETFYRKFNEVDKKLIEIFDEIYIKEALYNNL
jgi:GR25 family glycosyltransferase involved in LPS biosynthesis